MGDVKSQARMPLVPIRPAGTKTPIFMVPGPWTPLDYDSSDSQFFFYVQLFHLLGEDRPIYGLRTLGLGGRLKTYRSVEHMASDYATFVQSVQPQGPYLLAADCFGGVFMYEIGRRLSLENHVVKLIFFDSSFPSNTYKKWIVDDFFGYPGKEWVSAQFGRLPNLLAIVKNKKNPISNKCKTILSKMISFLKYKLSQKNSTEKKFNKEKIELIDLVLKYNPQASNVRIALLLTDDMYNFGQHDDWEKVAEGGFEIHRIPGTHGSYCNKFAKLTVAIINRIDNDHLDQGRLIVPSEQVTRTDPDSS